MKGILQLKIFIVVILVNLFDLIGGIGEAVLSQKFNAVPLNGIVGSRDNNTAVGFDMVDH